MSGLYAVCKDGNSIVVKRVPLDRDIQDEVNVLFRQQRNEFFEPINRETPYLGAYSPDDDQLLTVQNIPEIAIISEALDGNATALEVLDSENLRGERVKALCIRSDDEVIFQKFSTRQMLDRSRALMKFRRDDVFQRLESDVFVLGDIVVAVIQNGLIKFKRENDVRGFIDLSHIFRESTDDEVRAFFDDRLFSFDDVNELVSDINPTNRKRIFSIQRAGHIDENSGPQIREVAAAMEVEVVFDENDRVVVPTSKRDITILLQLLDDKIFRGNISQNRFYTNSTRQM